MIFAPITVARAIDAATQAAPSGAAAAARKAASDVECLTYDVERLLMISEALWTILKEQHGYDDNELIRRIAEIDLRDGRLDGKLSKEAPGQCPHCNRTLVKKRPYCMYCGKPVAVNPFER